MPPALAPRENKAPLAEPGFASWLTAGMAIRGSGGYVFMRPGNAARPPRSTVTFKKLSWPLLVDRDLAFGRSPECDICLPPDPYLSRRAGTLRALEDCILVRNDSSSKPIALRPPAGEDRLIEPGAATTSRPWPAFAVVLVGGDDTYRLEIRTPFARLTGEETGALTTAPETITAPLTLTGAQRRVLTALAAPILLNQGDQAAPATYSDIAQRLGLQPGYVRNVLKSLRESLSGYGFSGLTGTDSTTEHQANDFRWALARWAIRSSWVTAADVSAIPPTPAREKP